MKPRFFDAAHRPACKQHMFYDVPWWPNRNNHAFLRCFGGAVLSKRDGGLVGRAYSAEACCFSMVWERTAHGTKSCTVADKSVKAYW